MNKDKRLLIAIEPELKEKLQQDAKAAGVSMSEYVRRLLAIPVTVGTVKDGAVVWKKEGEMISTGLAIFIVIVFTAGYLLGKYVEGSES